MTIVKYRTIKYNILRILCKECRAMIVYDRFWATLRQSAQSTYTLIKDHHISSSTIDKLRKNKPLNTTTINDLCIILECRVEDIMEYVQSDDDQRL